MGPCATWKPRANVTIQAHTAPTVWTTAKAWANLLNPLSYGQPTPSRTLLHDFSGTLEGGEMLLVIGKPGSGCTTFLKMLANMGDEYKSTTGKMTYGSRPADERDPDPVRLTFCGTWLQRYISSMTRAE